MPQLATLAIARRRHLADAVRDVVEHVEAGHALAREQLGGVRFLLLQQRREHVAGANLVAARALDVQHGRLQDPAECQRLLRLAMAPAAELLERLGEVRVEIDAQLSQIDADGGQDLFALRVVR